jgi:hypothetical protein
LFQTQGRTPVEKYNTLETIYRKRFYLVHVTEWFKRFRVGCEDFEDDSKSGWLLTSQNLETAAKVCELMARKHQTTPKLIKEQLHSNHELVRHIHHIFGKEKILSEVCATVPWMRNKRKESQLVNFVPHSLMDEQQEKSHNL